MTPAARIAAAVALLEQLEAQPRRPADAVSNEFFRARRYIGGGDRRGLGDRRANAVKQFLLTLGVSADKLDTLSKGSLEAVKNGTPEQMAHDRRVEIVVLKQ